MIQFFVNHFTMICRIIAIIAMIIAAYEIRKALREIDKLLASCVARRVASLASINEKANL